MDNQISEIVKFALNVKNHKVIPPVWFHGHTKWKLCTTTGLYYFSKYNGTEYCLGDRYFYFTTDYNISNIRGSTSDNWHGYSFGVDLKKAVDWAKETTYSDLGYLLWTGK